MNKTNQWLKSCSMKGKALTSIAIAYDLAAHLADWIGFIALCTFACIQTTSGTDSFYMLIVMAICIFVDIRRSGPAMAHSAVGRLTFVVAIYVLLWTVVSSWLDPQLAHANYHRLLYWLTLLYFPLIAWFTRGQPKRVMAVLAFSLLGTLIGLLQAANWHQVAQDWVHTDRVHWLGSYVQSAFYLGTALLGLFSLVGRIVGRGRWQLLRVIAWLFVVAVLGEMLFLTESRNIILSLLVLLPLVMLVRLIWLARSGHRILVLAVGALVLLCAATLTLGNWHRIAQRYQQTTASLSKIVTTHKLPDTSLGMRFQLYEFGAKLWLERPIFGWGPGYEATQMNANAPKVAKTHDFTHLHDGYLVILVRFGIVGLLLIGALAFTLARDFLRALRDARVEPDIGLFLLSAITLGGLMNLATSQLVHTFYAFIHILLVGLAFGYVLAYQADQSVARPGLRVFMPNKARIHTL